ncbi:unnamed protein product, partial [Polarella glacialis]
VGASMGGFGALLHGGDLAGSILAFSPQANLLEASLRPTAASPEALRQMSENMFASIRAASKRGARVEVHCAADEHFLHAMSMPLEHVSLVVHTLLPRKPFARLLDKAQQLLPIFGDAVYRLLRDQPAPAMIRVGCWQRGGDLKRYVAEKGQLLSLLFGPASAELPRPADWFCGTCFRRNMTSHFLCWNCKDGGEFTSPITQAGAARIPDGSCYPRAGDWGCRRCGTAMCAYQWNCTGCGVSKWNPDRALVVT